MLNCPHCQTPIKLSELKPDFSYDRDRVPWYKFVQAKCACPQCKGLFVTASQIVTPWPQLALLAILTIALHEYGSMLIAIGFGLSEAAAEFFDRVVPKTILLASQISSVLLIRAKTRTHLVPVFPSED